MSVQNSAGIQRLLDAEREAQKIVQKARTYRSQRVKDARTEAAKEIEEYKAKKEAEFKKFEADHSGSNAAAEKAAEKEIESKLEEIKSHGQQNEGKVIEGLLKGVTDIAAEPHRNTQKV